MKTMSWSRYHALSWSFMRLRTHARYRGAKRARQAAKAAGIATSTAVETQEVGRAGIQEPVSRPPFPNA